MAAGAGAGWMNEEFELPACHAKDRSGLIGYSIAILWPRDVTSCTKPAFADSGARNGLAALMVLSGCFLIEGTVTYDRLRRSSRHNEAAAARSSILFHVLFISGISEVGLGIFADYNSLARERLWHAVQRDAARWVCAIHQYLRLKGLKHESGPNPSLWRTTGSCC
jgi:hypothetical protein